MEPFAAILIAHGTHVFFRGLLRPEGSKFEATGRERGGVLREGQPRLQIDYGPIKSLENVSSGRKCWTQLSFFYRALAAPRNPWVPLEPLSSTEPWFKITVLMILQQQLLLQKASLPTPASLLLTSV